MMQKFNWFVVLFALAAAAAVAVAALNSAAAQEHAPAPGPEPAPTPDSQQAEQEASEFNRKLRRDFQLPKMFDFERFKSAFGRHYSSALEEMVRAKLFMARAYRAFITALKYKYRNSSYYLAVNSRTDWTHEELEASLNRVALAQEPDEDDDSNEAAKTLRKLEAGEQPEEHLEPLVEPADVQAELARIHEHRSEPGFRELDAELRKMQSNGSDARRRRKRDAAAKPAMRANFDLSRAYERRAEQGGRVKRMDSARVASNNPHYEQPDVASEMSLEELAKQPGYKDTYYRDIRFGKQIRTYDHLPVKSRYTVKDRPYLLGLTQNFVSSISKWWYGKSDEAAPAPKEKKQKKEPVAGRGQKVADERDDDEQDVFYADEENVVWVDHREGGCMQPVQEQGHCGSCYAFASLAFLEWAHCKETGAPVKFSEQYVVDCANRIHNVEGCNGAVIDMIAPFVQNYGLELARHYPYKARDEQCPYDDETPLERMGYLRADTREIVRVPLPLVEEYLEHMPLMININTAGDFHFYGGGVFDGKQCAERGGHSVLLIGHGREDGEEYWLIRNSYSTAYGEEGHLRLNKNSDCIHPRRAQAFGNLRSKEIKIYSHRNWRVPEPVQKSPASGAASQPQQQSEALRKEIEMAKRREAERAKRTG